MSHSTKSILVGSLLVAGTSIGGGMLGLPVATAPGGFLPSLIFLLLSWAFMTSTGLMLGELCCRHGGRPNLVTLAKEALGNSGRAWAWILSIFLFSTLIIAYLVGLAGLIGRLFGIDASSLIIWVAIGAAIALWPKFQLLLRLNTLFMAILFGAYALFVFVGIPHIQGHLLERAVWLDAPFALPVLFTSFGFQGTVPSLASIMDYDSAKVRRSILIGTGIALAVYILWQAILLGVVPYAGGLEIAVREGQDAIAPLAHHVQAPHLFAVGEVFAFAAISTSLLGVGLGLLDFFADGLKLSLSKPLHALGLIALILVPTTVIAVNNPHIFLSALGVAGGIGCALLLGLLPLVLAIRKKALFGIFRKRYVLCLLFAFLLFELCIEAYNLI